MPPLSLDARRRLNAALLMLGGALGIYAHVRHLHPPADLAALPAYTAASGPVHLALLAAVVLVTAGLPGLAAALDRSLTIMALLGVAALYVGLIGSDLLHCVLEMAAYPALAQHPSNATFAIVQDMNREPLLALPNLLGGPLVLLGTISVARTVHRARTLPRWPAMLLACSAIVTVLAFVPMTPAVVRERFPVVFYAAVAALGYALRRAPAATDPHDTLTPA